MRTLSLIHTHRHRHIDIHTDTHTDRERDRQTDRQTDRESGGGGGGGRERERECRLFAKRLSSMLVYVGVRSLQTIAHAATLR